MPANSTSQLIGDLVVLVWQGLALAFAYGLVTMIAIQFLKDFFLREALNRNYFDVWFKGLGGEEEQRKTLIWLAAAGEESALFSLPVEKMCGQIGVAVNAILEAPKEYSKLLTALGKDNPDSKSSPSPNDRPPSPVNPSESDAVRSDLNILIDTDPDLLRPGPSGISLANPEIVTRFADARTRVSHRIQRQIDRLQLSSASSWTRTNRATSIAISISIGMAPAYLRGWLSGRYGTFQLISVLPASIVLSLIGGLLAPFLRDLVTRQSRPE